MAKALAPLFSFGASGAIGRALVFFDWKGLNCVRQYVIPANPKTTKQTTQRSHLTDAVSLWHAASPSSDDVAGYRLLGSTFPTPRTGFNQACKEVIDSRIANSNKRAIYHSWSCTPGAAQLAVELTVEGDDPTNGKFFYGLSKSAMLETEAATIEGTPTTCSATITGLVAGTKYFVQFRPNAADPNEDCDSGIYAEYTSAS